MEDFEMSTRLRSACDSCHRLKRKCTGVVPCDNCNMIGSNCTYSLANKLGRPRGSKTRRVAESTAPPATQEPTPGPAPDIDTSAAGFDAMMYLDFDGFESGPATYGNTKIRDFSPQTVSNIFAASDTDGCVPFEPLGSYESQGTAGLAISERTITSTHQRAASQHRDTMQGLSRPVSKRRKSSEPENNYDDTAQLGQTQARPAAAQRINASNANPFPRCQCLQNLSSLLEDLKHAECDATSTTAFDSLLFRVSEAGTRWNALVACTCWRCINDNLDTLLLAALSIRRVVTLLHDIGQAIESQPPSSASLDGVAPKLYVGSFEVQGPEKIVVLGILRKVTVRKLGAAITTMQGLLKQARPDASDTSTVSYINSLLSESAGQNK